MGKYRFYYHPDDEDSDFKFGDHYKGKVSRIILSQNKHLRAVEVTFPDGKTTTVHKKSFEVSDTAIDFYPPGAFITLKKVGYMADRRVTKWVVICPLKYDLHRPDGIKDMLEVKRQKAGETTKYQPLTSSHQQEKLSIVARLMRTINSIFSRV